MSESPERTVVEPIGYVLVGTILDEEHAARFGAVPGVPLQVADEAAPVFESPEEAEAWLREEEPDGVHPAVRLDVAALVPVRTLSEGSPARG